MSFGGKLVVLGGIIYGLLFLNLSAHATTAAELQDMQIISHHFTTELTSRSYRYSVKEVDEQRYVVLKMSARLPGGEGKVFTNDFALGYFHADEKEDRAKCAGIADAETADPGDIGVFVLGEAAWSKISAGTTYFALAFAVESDVETINIYRLGTSDVITYRIGPERKFSVFITTNRSDSQFLRDVKQTILDGGYEVTKTSNKLNDEETGITIQYREKAEAAAREMSQRLMTKFNVLPKVEKMDLLSEVDVVIWLGK